MTTRLVNPPSPASGQANPGLMEWSPLAVAPCKAVLSTPTLKLCTGAANIKENGKKFNDSWSHLIEFYLNCFFLSFLLPKIQVNHKEQMWMFRSPCRTSTKHDEHQQVSCDSQVHNLHQQQNSLVMCEGCLTEWPVDVRGVWQNGLLMCAEGLTVWHVDAWGGSDRMAWWCVRGVRQNSLLMCVCGGGWIEWPVDVCAGGGVNRTEWPGDVCSGSNGMACWWRREGLRMACWMCAWGLTELPVDVRTDVVVS